MSKMLVEERAGGLAHVCISSKSTDPIRLPEGGRTGITKSGKKQAVSLERRISGLKACGQTYSPSRVDQATGG